MKVLIVNSYPTGGAANAAIRLHHGLLKNGIDSKILFFEGAAGHTIQHSAFFHGSITPRSIKRRIIDKLKRTFNISASKNAEAKARIRSLVPKRIEWFSFPDTGIDITNHPFYKDADIINLHWVADFIDYSFLKKNKKPVVWTMHDMNPFTGGCHYSGDCEGYMSGCKTCPQLLPPDETFTEGMFAIKAKYFSSVTNLSFVSPSNWLADLGDKSVLLKKFQHHHIFNGIDTANIFPEEKNEARKKLGLPLDKKVILFVANSLGTSRKGYAVLIEAMKLIEGEAVVLCSAGSSNKESADGLTVFELGMINGEKNMRTVYSAADVFVIPSLEDNLPNTVVESLLCGVPVIGFPIGGIPDMVQDGKNGYLAEQINPVSLAAAIQKYLQHPELFDREKIRQDAIRKFDFDIQAKAYIALYQEMLDKQH